MTANTFIINNDPVKLIDELINIQKSYNKKRKFKLLDFFYKLWILKIKYPLFEYRLKKIENNTVDYLYDNPSSFITILNRYIVYFIFYCKIFKLSFKTLLDNIFHNNELELEIFTEDYKDGIRINKYNIISRFNMPTVLNTEQKYTISKAYIDIDHDQFELNQTVYDTDTMENYAMSNILYKKYFRLDSNGELYNPNYFIDKTLMDDDLKYCKYIIMHIMAAIGSVFEITSKLYFMKKK